MIARALVALALVASVGFATPWTSPEAAGERSAQAPAVDPLLRLHRAVEQATHRHVPGAAGSGWVLHGVKRSEPGIDGREFIVATGVITAAGAPDTMMRLTGRYDPDTGELTRVSYKLHSSTPTAPSRDAGWSLQRAVQQAFAEVLPDQSIHFALASAQSSRVEGGGRRFEGSGIGTWADSDARFVAFTLTMSARGEMVEFDYRTQGPGEDAVAVAGR